MQTIRAILIAISFVVFTVSLIPIQVLFLAVNSKYKRTFPRWYCQRVCAMMGIRIHISGQIKKDQPVFLISNHTSWADIIVLGAVTPVSFVAKKEVAGWFFFGYLSKLARTVYVDRERRTASGKTSGEMTKRLLEGDTIVLFAEGTSNDGNRVLPFKTALFAAVEMNRRVQQQDDLKITVQTSSIAYTHRHGLPIGRKGRPIIAWYGDMDLLSHMWEIFKYGPFDVHVKIGEPLPLEQTGNRKELARRTEQEVHQGVRNLLSSGEYVS